jgi:hypothetical protein
VTVAADPARTYAFAVGVERYDTGAAWHLDGPAADASRFVSWLLSRGVPASQILLFLSPLAESPLARVGSPLAEAGSPLVGAAAGRAGVDVRPARRAPISDALAHEVTAWRGDLLWLFWSGHGALTSDGSLRLFYADASTHDKRNLDWTSLLTALRSDRYPGLPRQIGIVDACQTYAEALHLASTLPGDTFAYGKPLPSHEQFGLYAAGPGERAINVGAEKSGLFSQAVMAELTGDGHWPPDMDTVASSLDARFVTLRAAGQTRQTPTTFRWRTWKGSERVLGATAPRPTARQPKKPSGEAVRDLVDKLLDIHAMADHDARAIVIRQLPKGFATSIPHSPNDRPHVVNIVNRSLYYAGGLAELVDIVRSNAADPDDPALAEVEAVARRVAAEAGQEWPE